MSLRQSTLHAIVLCSVLLMGAAGCTSVPSVNEQTLVRLYAEQRHSSHRGIAIFIPGVMGSVLEDPTTGKVVWGQILEAGFFDLLALPIDTASLAAGRESLVPVQVLGSLSWFGGLVHKGVYGKAARIIVEAGGYLEGDLNHPQPGETLYDLRYDWRKDLVESAQQLGESIERLKTAFHQPDLKVTLICHSAGGLVARYYAKYGTVDVLDQDPLPPPTYAGAANIAKIVMLGTPNAGSMEMFQRLHEGFWVPLVGRLSPETLFTMPAAYELLPHEGTSVFVTKRGESLPVNLYDSKNWERYGWSVFDPSRQARLRARFHRQYGRKWEEKYQERLAAQHRFLATVLSRAQRFQQALRAGRPDEEQARVHYIVMGADCQPTIRKALLEQSASGWRTHFRPWSLKLQSVLYGLGDMSVTKESLLGFYHGTEETAPPYRLPGARAMFFCDEHSDLVRNVTFMDNVLHTVLEE